MAGTSATILLPQRAPRTVTRDLWSHSRLVSTSVPIHSLISYVAQNLLPRFPILLEVYHGVHEALQEERERHSDG